MRLLAMAALPGGLLFSRRRQYLAAHRRDILFTPGQRLGLVGGLLPLFDQLTDRVPALLADLLVEAPAPLRLDRLAALAADLLVEGVPVLVANRLAALAAGFAHRHGTLLLHHLIRHFPTPPVHRPLLRGKLCEIRP